MGAEVLYCRLMPPDVQLIPLPVAAQHAPQLAVPNMRPSMGLEIKSFNSIRIVEPNGWCAQHPVIQAQRIVQVNEMVIELSGGVGE